MHSGSKHAHLCMCYEWADADKKDVSKLWWSYFSKISILRDGIDTEFINVCQVRSGNKHAHPTFIWRKSLIKELIVKKPK